MKLIMRADDLGFSEAVNFRNLIKQLKMVSLPVLEL